MLKEVIAKSLKLKNRSGISYKMLAGAKRECQSLSQAFKLKMTNYIRLRLYYCSTAT